MDGREQTNTPAEARLFEKAGLLNTIPLLVQRQSYHACLLICVMVGAVQRRLFPKNETDR